MVAFNNNGESRRTIEEMIKLVQAYETYGDTREQSMLDLEMMLEKIVRDKRFKTGERVSDEE